MKPVVVKDLENTIRIGYSGKALGNTYAGLSLDGRANFAKFMDNFPGKVAYVMPAVGGDVILNIDNTEPAALDKMEADALITTKKQNLLVLKSADCIPLVLFIPAQSILALAHVGTSGAILHLPEKLVRSLKAEPAKIHCYIGPSISQKSYRFEKDKFEKKLDSSWDKYLSKEKDGIHINLFGRVFDELLNSGVKKEKIVSEAIDTAGNPNYFSHRRHRLTGEEDGRNCLAVYLT